MPGARDRVKPVNVESTDQLQFGSIYALSALAGCCHRHEPWANLQRFNHGSMPKSHACPTCGNSTFDVEHRRAVATIECVNINGPPIPPRALEDAVHNPQLAINLLIALLMDQTRRQAAYSSS